MGDEEEAFVPLTHEILCQCLSQIKHVVDGGLAFTRLDCSNKELTNLGNKVEDYKQLLHIVLSDNRLNDITAVTQLPHLLTLRIDNNEVASLDCMKEAALPWCQRLNISANKLTALPSLATLERLRFLSLANNAITSLEGFGGHQVLEELDLKENQLTTLLGLGELGSLRSLTLAGNQLTSLEGLSAPLLARLDASGNQLASLEHIAGAPGLLDLDLQSNQFDAEDPNLPELRKLGQDTPRLQSLQISGNPLADTFGDGTKVEVLVCAQQLLLVDGDEVTEEDRDAARERLQELVDAALAREKEEALAREQAEAEADGDGDEAEEEG